MGTWSNDYCTPFISFTQGDAKVNAWWIVLFYVVLMFAEGFTCPIGYSITAVAAPKAFVTQMMTVWSMSQSVGAALNMILVNFYKEGSEVPFFIGIGAVVAILGAVVLALSARNLQKEWEWKEKRRKFLENKSNKCPLKEEVIKSIKKILVRQRCPARTFLILYHFAIFCNKGGK